MTKRRCRAKTPLERLMEKVIPEPNSGCWFFMGCVDERGYGDLHVDGHTEQAHSVAYRLLHGPISEGFVLDHKCRVHCCVNPDHLEPVTQAENMRRGNVWNVAGEWLRRKTHCPKGHPYDGDNLVTRSDRAGRGCRQCRRLASQAYKDRQKEKRYGPH